MLGNLRRALASRPRVVGVFLFALVLLFGAASLVPPLCIYYLNGPSVAEITKAAQALAGKGDVLNVPLVFDDKGNPRYRSGSYRRFSSYDNYILSENLIGQVTRVNRSACSTVKSLGGDVDSFSSSDGKRLDGAWPICEDAKFRSRKCTAMTFGINEDSSFEEALIEKYGCEVFAYDPTITRIKSETEYAKQIHFFPQGIHGDDSRDKYKTLGHLMNASHLSMVDVLKVDAEYYEWAMLHSTLPFNIMRDKVRQFDVEIHMLPEQFGGYQDRCAPDDQDCVGDMLTYFTSLITSLQEQGFVLYDSHENPHSARWWVWSGLRLRRYSCCFELSFVNTNLFPQS